MMETLFHSDAADILQDSTEVILDSLLSDGIVKEIPIIQTVMNIWKTVSTVQNALLIKKIVAFLVEFEKTTQAERDAFIHKVENDSKYEREIGETIITLLDRYDDHLEKPIILAKLFCAYVREEINYDSFLWLATAVERSFILDLRIMLNIYAGKHPPQEQITKAKRNLFPSRLSDFYVLTETERKRGGLENPQIYSFNEDADLLAKIILGDQIQEEFLIRNNTGFR